MELTDIIMLTKIVKLMKELISHAVITQIVSLLLSMVHADCVGKRYSLCCFISRGIFNLLNGYCPPRPLVLLLVLPPLLPHWPKS